MIVSTSFFVLFLALIMRVSSSSINRSINSSAAINYPPGNLIWLLKPPLLHSFVTVIRPLKDRCKTVIRLFLLDYLILTRGIFVGAPFSADAFWSNLLNTHKAKHKHVCQMCLLLNKMVCQHISLLRLSICLTLSVWITMNPPRVWRPNSKTCFLLLWNPDSGSETKKATFSLCKRTNSLALHFFRQSRVNPTTQRRKQFKKHRSQRFKSKFEAQTAFIWSSNKPNVG